MQTPPLDRETNLTTQTSMLHVRVDEQLKKNAAETLAKFGLTISDAVKILLTRIEKEGALAAGLTADPEAYDAWFRAKVREAMENRAGCRSPAGDGCDQGKPQRGEVTSMLRHAGSA